MKIQIGKEKINMKYGLRAMIMYENITGHSFAPTTMTDVITFLYCIVITSSNKYDLSFDDFIDYLDNHPDKIQEFTDWLNEVIAVNNVVKKS